MIPSAVRCATWRRIAHDAVRRRTSTSSSSSSSWRCKGDYGFNVFHNSNPQHGGSYARHERRMRDDEVEDFLKSVKGWRSVYEVEQEQDAPQQQQQQREHDDATSAPPTSLRMGEEAICRTFTFDSFREAYLFMGRVWAFCYSSDKYPPLVWENTSITVYLYSPSFQGLSKREAMLAAFLNDQANMVVKSKRQQDRLTNNNNNNNTPHGAREGAQVGSTIRSFSSAATHDLLAAREARRNEDLAELKNGPTHWSKMMPPV